MEAQAEAEAERSQPDDGGPTAKEAVRIFHPDTGLIVGLGTTERTMKGSIDLEAAVEAGLAPAGHGG